MPLIVLVGAICLFSFFIEHWPVILCTFVIIILLCLIGVFLDIPSKKKIENKSLQKSESFFQTKAIEVGTGVCAVGQAANERMLAGNDDIIKDVKYCATLDNHCCPQCWPLDGMEFPKNIYARPPVPRHEGCRCFYAAVPKTWRDFGIDLDDEPRQIKRPWVLADYQYTYKRDPTKKLKKPRRIIRKHGQFFGTAEEWIQSLPKKEQRQFFPSDLAYLLWKERKITGLELLNPKNWELRSDKELCKLVGMDSLPVELPTNLKTEPGLELTSEPKIKPKPKADYALKPQRPKKTKGNAVLERQCRQYGIFLEYVEILWDKATKRYVMEDGTQIKRAEDAVMWRLRAEGFQGTVWELHPVMMLIQGACLKCLKQGAQSLFMEDFRSRTFSKQITIYGLNRQEIMSVIKEKSQADILRGWAEIYSNEQMQRWFPDLTKEDMEAVLDGLGLERFYQIAEMLFDDPEDNGNGWPDIFAWNGEKMILVEVKTTDTLHDSQIYTWTNLLPKLGLDAKVVCLKKTPQGS